MGCNYPSKAFGLAGAVNDAFLIADCLQQGFGFDPENVCVLHDIYPGQKKSMKVDPSKKPTRVNILQRLQWLVRNAKPGDVLFFSFSGYGLQVDDMDGYHDEGYDEAILPTDFMDGRDGDFTVIVASDIHDVLMGIPPNVAATVLMDCDHATSVIDVSGTLDGNLVGGLKFNTFCGLKTHTTKVQLASHNRDVWQEERARNVKARPRFQPMMEIDNPRKGRLPTRPAMSRASPVAFCYSAAGHGQTAMEMQMMRMVDGKEAPKQHGILTWCFVQALEELRHDCTHSDLSRAIARQMDLLRERDLPRMDQAVLLTFSTPRSDPNTMRVLQPLLAHNARGPSSGCAGDANPVMAPPVVPPPPPGFIASQMQSGSGGRTLSESNEQVSHPERSGQLTGPLGAPPGTSSGGLLHYDSFGGYGGMHSMPMGGQGRHSPRSGTPHRDNADVFREQHVVPLQHTCQGTVPVRRGASMEADDALPPPPPPPPPPAAAMGIPGPGTLANSSGSSYPPFPQPSATAGGPPGASGFLPVQSAGAAGYPLPPHAPGASAQVGMPVRGLTPPSLLQGFASPQGPQGGVSVAPSVQPATPHMPTYGHHLGPQMGLGPMAATPQASIGMGPMQRQSMGHL